MSQFCSKNPVLNKQYALNYMDNAFQFPLYVRGQRYYWHEKKGNGFAIGIPLNFHRGRARTLYIPIICAGKRTPTDLPQAGTAIMESVIACAKHMGFERIWLCSLPVEKLLNFYLGLGFMFGPLCPGENAQTLQNFRLSDESRVLVRQVQKEYERPPVRLRNLLPKTFYQVYNLGGEYQIKNDARTAKNRAQRKYWKHDHPKRNNPTMHWNGDNDGYLMTKCLY